MVVAMAFQVTAPRAPALGQEIKHSPAIRKYHAFIKVDERNVLQAAVRIVAGGAGGGCRGNQPERRPVAAPPLPAPPPGKLSWESRWRKPRGGRKSGDGKVAGSGYAPSTLRSGWKQLELSRYVGSVQGEGFVVQDASAAVAAIAEGVAFDGLGNSVAGFVTCGE